MGVVLAGGRSSRMGQNKALMQFEGKPLLEHMVSLLMSTGIENIKISGKVEGYDCEVDEDLFEGPAKAIESIIRNFPNVESFLFVPVDMPFLTPESLQRLMRGGDSAYYQDWPLPAFVRPNGRVQNSSSVRNFMEKQVAKVITISKNYEDNFVNINTPEEWEKAVKS